jgi:CRISPR/Cas system CSM-associated protein Csm3 (group 7 of RAMP superfamily)
MTQNKYYTVTLTTLEPLRVGGKEDPLSAADQALSAVGGRVCIPGATLKGAYRSELEKWLWDTYFEKVPGKWKHPCLRPCIPSNQLSRDEGALQEKHRYRGGGCSYNTSKRKWKEDNVRKETDDIAVCPVCYLLGSMGLVGFINVPFLFTNVSYEALYSARIERASGTVMKHANRGYQLIPPDTIFSGELEVLTRDDFLGWEIGKQRPLKENPKADAWLDESKTPDGQPWNADTLLNYMVLDRLRAIGRIGGYRSKGFGKVKIDVKEMSPSASSTA